MPVLSRKDLKYSYYWSADKGDNPKLTGSPDDDLFDRHEGYEVLPFINSFAENSGLKFKASGLKAEKLIREYLPSNVRSRANVAHWLSRNWDMFK